MSKNREPAREMATAASPAAATAWVRASHVKGGMISRREKSRGGPTVRSGGPGRSDDRYGSHDAGELTALSALRRSGGSLRSLLSALRRSGGSLRSLLSALRRSGGSLRSHLHRTQAPQPLPRRWTQVRGGS